VDAKLRHARKLFDDLRDQVGPESIVAVNRLEGIVAMSIELLGDLHSYKGALGTRINFTGAQLEEELNRLAEQIGWLSTQNTRS